ncbi:MAG TPA: 50S ribosomal protein L2 [Spirochaetota bacterium]|nr:50S ribosomal protein L2 [Spirochaetota bacterium]HOM37917.1 50S ribosomal protein L2 [Spirochaetota bacterium]HPQ48721.1 50S ribosomal protein L2 [Spirochaetota bacterium]
MALKKFKPITPGLRFKSVADFSVLTTDEPEKSLTKGKKSSSGRNSAGRITVRRRGGGHKRKYRFVDFKREKRNIKAIVKTIEYDPNRTSYISLVEYEDGEKRYILTPYGIQVGSEIIAGENVKPEIGNALPLKNIPVGMDIHNIELYKNRGGQIVRAAGSSAQVVSKEGEYCSVKLPSGEVRLIHKDCYATIGRVSNIDNSEVVLGKAGRSRWMGMRPKVRGTVMNPVDHPHGGGEGRTKGRHPVTPWGKPTKGYKTRRGRRPSDKFIIKKRK